LFLERVKSEFVPISPARQDWHMSNFGVSSSVANLKRVAVRTPTRDADYQGAHWLGAPADATALDEVRNDATWVTRRVCGNGVITVAWQQVSVGRHRE